MADHVLSQDDIDRVFDNLREEKNNENSSEKAALPYDFRRPDRVAKDQLRSLHALHENFARSLGSSLAGYLRAPLSVSLISVEQLSFSEVISSLTFPTCVLGLNIVPQMGKAFLETSHSIVFPFLEILLGGKLKKSVPVDRDTTQIEKSLLEGIWRIVLQDLKNAWQPVASIEFVYESYKNSPQLVQYFAPNEGIIAISLELKLDEHNGLMNICIPSIVVKMLRQAGRQKDHNTPSSEAEQARMLKLIRNARTTIDVRLAGTRMLLKHLMDLEVGDVLSFDYPLSKEVDLQINGIDKFCGHIVTAGHKRAFQVKAMKPTD